MAWAPPHFQGYGHPHRREDDYFALSRPYGGGGGGGGGHHYGGGGGGGDRRPQQHRGPRGGVGKRRNRGHNQHEPSLNKLRRANAGQARQHFGSGGHRGRETPLSVPPAPDNDNHFLTHADGALASPTNPTGFHVVTPSLFAPPSGSHGPGYWKNSYSTVDKDAAQLGTLAGLDMYGSNAGLDDGGLDSDEDGFTSSSDREEDQEERVQSGTGVTDAARTIEQQAACIAELTETNLNLKEKLYLLEQQLARLQQPPADANPSSSHSEGGDDAGEMEKEAATTEA